MKVYVSVDMEGISGLTDPEEMHAGGRGYERGCELMTGDANAAVTAAFKAGADQVVVNDAHGSTKNLRADLIDERCVLVRGPGKALRMGQGLDVDTTAAMFVGYHARAGATHGVLNHTWMGKEIHNISLNGEIVGEIGLVAGFAGSYGVPVVLVTGDEAACAEAKDVLGNVEAAVVKKGIDRFSAEVVPPQRAQQEIHEAARSALANLDAYSPHAVSHPYTLAIEWNSTAIASSCALIPGVRLTDERTTELTTEDYAEVMGLLGVFASLAGSVACSSGVYG